MSKILISYRREDSADVTGRIDDRLVQQFGRETVFLVMDSATDPELVSCGGCWI